MLIAPQDAEDFLQTYIALMHYAGTQREVIPADMPLTVFKDKTSMEVKADCRDAIYEPSSLIQTFIETMGETLSETQQKEVKAWERYRKEKFIVIKHTTTESVFLSSTNTKEGFAVLSLTSDLAHYVKVPQIVETALLPFRGVIVCDGLLRAGLLVGRTMGQEFLEQYKAIKHKGNIRRTL